MIDIAKKYKTRDGRDVVLYTTTREGIWPVVGDIVKDSGLRLQFWDKFGNCYPGYKTASDLVEVKPINVYERWVNIYPSGKSISWLSRQDADDNGEGRIACIHIKNEFREGEGL
jgi:hypothetical protein